jgi:hypothetical protein
LKDAFVFWSHESRDTALHVVHGRSSNRDWSDPSDPSFVWWRQPASDRLVVWFGTGFGGVDFEFQVADDGLRGFVATHSDRSGAPVWRAPVAGQRVRCPPAPPPIGRLRLSVSDSAPSSKPAGWRGLVLTTERQVDCGGAWINYYGIVSADRLAVRVRGIAGPTGGCKAGRGPATTYLDLPAGSRRVVLLIKHEGDTNRFVLARTGRSLALITQHATTVVADERVRVWPRGDRRDE